MTATRPSSRELDPHQVAWQVTSLLLAYPDEELRGRLPLLRRIVGGLPPELGEPLGRFVAHAEATPLLEVAAHYVETFDHRRRCCLYLTYYAHGDTRKRGMALLTFKAAYRRAGLVLGPDELPDHLAVVLEFAATTDPRAGRKLLVDHRAGIELLRLALEESGSPYAQVLRAVTATLPPLRGDERAAVARLAAEGPPVEEVGLQPFAPPEYMPQTEGARR
ncbi:MAG: nitrate reductase molybdenum cofactor assembly chaperone [Actinomycetes bacterium]